METYTVTSTEFQNRAGRFIDQAARGPVVITKHKTPARVLLDYETYRKLLSRQAPVALAAQELPDDAVEALSNAKMDPRHDHLNALLD